MKKVNPYTGIGILIGLIGFVLFWMKVDTRGIVLLTFFLIFGGILLFQLFQKKLVNNRWGYALLLLAIAVIVQTVISLFTQQFYWPGILIPAAMYTLIYEKIYPKESF
jgi:chromate transport protein ChrA